MNTTYHIVIHAFFANKEAFNNNIMELYAFSHKSFET